MDGAILRGIRNLFHSKVRTCLTIFIIALCITLALVVLSINHGANNEIYQIQSEVGTMIEIKPYGSFGFFNNNRLDLNTIEVLENMEHTKKITPYITTPLKVPIEKKQEMSEEVTSGNNPVVIGIGVTKDTNLYYNGRAATIVEGRTLQPYDINTNRGVVGFKLAEKNNLVVGDIWEVEGIDIEVIGICHSTNRQLAQGVFMSFETVQDAFAVEGVQQITLTADNISNVDKIVANLEQNLGEEADIITHKDTVTGQLDESLGNLDVILKIVLIISIVLGSLLVIITMIISARERIREIGTLRALGAYKKEIVFQFCTESVLLSLMSFIVGTIIYFISGSAISNIFIRLGISQPVNSTALNNSVLTDGLFLFRNYETKGVQDAIDWVIRGPREMISTFNMGSTEVVLTLDTYLWVLGITVLLGIIGGLIPGIYSSCLKPAEVLRRG